MVYIGAQAAADYLYAAGFRNYRQRDEWTLSVAICGGESSYNTSAHYHTSREDSWGLMQINLYAHPQYSVAECLDPETNCKIARTIYVDAGDSFTPWGSYTDGRYLQYWSQAAAATNGPAGQPPPVGPPGLPPNPPTPTDSGPIMHVIRRDLEFVAGHAIGASATILRFTGG